MLDIEPAFSPLISICTELATPAGYVDNVWVTPEGGLVLGECKLVRNPQARREVVAQALEYARAIGEWTYEDLEREVRRALKQPLANIWELIEPSTDLEEHQFIDAIERRLRSGRLMILILGDGIQEGVEALTEYLQLHAGIHAGMALVDLSIWDDPAGGFLVVPRVPMRTVLIERGIVVVDKDLGVRISPPSTVDATRKLSASASPRSATASEAEFYEQLEERRPGVGAGLRDFLGKLIDVGVQPLFKKTAILRFASSSGRALSAGYVDNLGRAWLSDPYYQAAAAGRPEVAKLYYQAIAAAVGGFPRSIEDGVAPNGDGPDGRGINVALLLQHADAWRGAIAAYVEAMRREDE